jgi:hypothetical protein
LWRGHKRFGCAYAKAWQAITDKGKMGSNSWREHALTVVYRMLLVPFCTRFLKLKKLSEFRKCYRTDSGFPGLSEQPGSHGAAAGRAVDQVVGGTGKQLGASVAPLVFATPTFARARSWAAEGFEEKLAKMKVRGAQLFRQ